LLAPRGGESLLDCTAGRGGHAVAIIPKLVPGGRYVGLDVDPANVAFVTRRLADAPVPADVVKANFTAARAVLDSLNVERVDLLLADLGFASTQMDDPQRGFSFSQDGPLDMRLDPDLPLSAADLCNALPQDELADVIYRFGEERRSRRIAQKIVEARRRTPMKTTAQLAQIVRQAMPGTRARSRGKGKSAGGKGTRIDPATRTFMALRIAVNQEIDALQNLLDNLADLIAPQGRAAFISFHSLEDRLVKQAFAQLERDEQGKRLTRKPVIAEDDERAANPRSRSAKLRAFRFN